MTIKQRIIWVFTALTTMLMIVIAIISYYSIRQIYLDQLTEETRVITSLVARQLDAKYLSYLSDPSLDRAREIYSDQLNTAIQDIELSNAFLFDASLNTILETAENGSDGHQLSLNRAEISQLQQGESIASLPFRAENNTWYLWGFTRLDDSHWLGIKLSASRLAEIESLARTFFMIGIIGIFLTILCGWLLARHIARPIERLVDFSAALGKGNFDTDVPGRLSGELAILAGAMDKMRLGLAENHREREAMLAQIAHEIRNPLGGIELLAGLIREDSNSEYAERILSEVATLKGLITAYLNYSRPVKANPTHTNITVLLEEAFQICSRSATEKDIRYEVDLQEKQAFFDANHLRQIFLNLLSNAIEASPTGSLIRIHSIRRDEENSIRFSDQGDGLPDMNTDQLFEPFYTTRPEGTGLGLAVCRKLCIENNARISAGNLPNGGAEFTISTIAVNSTEGLPIQEKSITVNE